MIGTVIQVSGRYVVFQCSLGYGTLELLGVHAVVCGEKIEGNFLQLGALSMERISTGQMEFAILRVVSQSKQHAVFAATSSRE
ncbi:MAG: hypothetical protein NXI04_18505 [Planctomycetaceae bacterium]|nr:hypothetical protein [Planctomycetaceae bacterium]